MCPEVPGLLLPAGSGIAAAPAAPAPARSRPKPMDHVRELSIVHPTPPLGRHQDVRRGPGMGWRKTFPFLWLLYPGSASTPWDGAQLGAESWSQLGGLVAQKAHASCRTPPTGAQRQEPGSPPSHPRSSRQLLPRLRRIQDGYSGATKRNKQTNTQTPLLVPTATGGTKPCSEGPSSE